jgi:hypothetical protein
VKQQTSSKEEETMTSTNEVADNMFEDENRPFLLAAQKYRAKLQKSDTEDLFSIARRLRTQFEAKKAADAADTSQRPEATVFDASAHRPGFRDGTQWRHDRRKKRTTEEYDPEGRQQATYVSTSEEEDEPEKSLSDARNAYLDYVQNAYKQGR